MRRILVITALLVGTTAPLVFAADPITRTVSGDEDLSAMTPEQMVTQASSLVRTMENQLAESFKLLEESLAKGDISATSARNEAITAMKGLVRLSEQNLLTLQQRAAERDRQRVEHEFVKITIASAKVAELYAQIKSAAGLPVDLELTDVERQLEFRGRLPVVESLTTTFNEPTDVPEPPPHASPYF